MIFVQIASYRDPELVKTIEHCLKMAKYPDDLRFGICFQHAEDEFLPDRILMDKRFRVIDVPYQESKGACWARNLTQSLYNNEEYTMQIDSHSRFVQDWDEIVVKMWESLYDPMALLTCYPPNYDPNQVPGAWYKTPQICNVYKFIHKYIVSRPMDMPDLDVRTIPRRGVFVAAGFMFGPGKIIQDVPYDPNFYFTGEESALAVRFFTKGYNIYHPHKLILHHYYSRPDHAKHWSDHSDWGKYDGTSHERLDALLGYSEMDLGIYGLGTIRTLEDYKNYAGIDFKNKLVHEYTEKGGEPPHQYDESGWQNVTETYNKLFTWDADQIDSAEDVTFWALIVQDQDGTAIYRQDVLAVHEPEIIEKLRTEKFLTFNHNPYKQKVTSLLIWPYSQSKGWLQSTTFAV